MHTSKKVTVLMVLVFLMMLCASPSWAGEIKGKVTTVGLRSAENIAVYVEAIPAKHFPPPIHPAIIDQKKLIYIPHVTVVLKGTTVEFLNSDAVDHNVYWPSVSGNKKFGHNLGTFPPGGKKSFQFNDVGMVPLLCNVHPEMSAYVIVVPTPYYALTDKEGNFEIKSIPEGHYTLKTWAEGARATTQAVDVSSSATSVELTVRK